MKSELIFLNPADHKAIRMHADRIQEAYKIKPIGKRIYDAIKEKEKTEKMYLLDPTPTRYNIAHAILWHRIYAIHNKNNSRSFHVYEALRLRATMCTNAIVHTHNGKSIIMPGFFTVKDTYSTPNR